MFIFGFSMFGRRYQVFLSSPVEIVREESFDVEWTAIEAILAGARLSGFSEAFKTAYLGR